MKKTSNYIILLCLSFCTLLACKKMDDTYKQFIVPGGLIYPGKASAAQLYAGNHRIKLAWLRGADPNVTKARIFWNNFADSVEINIPPTGDTISYIVNNLEEKAYSFVIKTYDKEGRISIPVELFGNSYGEKYQASLLSRPIKSSELDSDRNFNIQWANANITGGAYAMDIKYANQAGDTVMKRFKATEALSSIPTYTFGDSYQYRTVYVPDSLSIDTFYTAFIPQRIADKIDKSNWTATADNFALNLMPNGPPNNAIDDKINTYWHTDYTTAAKPPFPHWMAVDLKTMANPIHVTRVELTCRPGVTNSFTAFTIQGSLNGTDWTSYNSFAFAQQDPTQSFTITGAPAMNFIRVFATAGSTYYASLAEFSVYGYSTQSVEKRLH